MRLKMISHRDALAFVKERFGAAALDRLVLGLSESDRELATVNAKVISGWVEVDVHVRLLAAIKDELAKGDESVLLEMGEWIATEQLTGIYRMFLMVVSPEFMLKRSSLIFHTFYDEGAMDVKVLAPGEVECSFRGFNDTQRLIELSISGWFAGAAKLSRARDQSVRITTSLAQQKGEFRVLFRYTNPGS